MDDETTASVCTPRLFHIDSCRYRSNLPPLKSGDVLPYYEYDDDAMNVETDIDPIVKNEETGIYSCNIKSIPGACYRFIIGQGGSTKKIVEKDTNTRISVQSTTRGERGQGKKGNESIIIEGQSFNDVEACRTRLQCIAEDAIQKKLAPTHFVSVPLNFPEQKDSIAAFKDMIAATFSEEIKGLHDDMFVDSDSFHVTVGVLKLYHQGDVELAIQTLEECAQEIKKLLVDDSHHVVAVKGIGSFPVENAAKTNVLWANVVSNPSPIFQNAMNIIAAAFHAKGLMDEDTVVIHATIINSKHHKQKGRYPKRIQFDARAILSDEALCGFDFGRATVATLHLSKMKRNKGEYYEPEFIVEL
eukprot:m.8684 g.8684  ORF g.8684 m.8684 type:complete len:358 (-) comp3221_c0_seq1:736-1809(-)